MPRFGRFRFNSRRDRFERSATPLLALRALPMLVACTGIESASIPNTEQGRLPLAVKRALHTTLDDVSELRFNTARPGSPCGLTPPRSRAASTRCW
jgi:hypothetical protein